MSDSIKDAFKKREEPKSEGFSLLAAFGRKDESDEDMGNEVNIFSPQCLNLSKSRLLFSSAEMFKKAL